MDFFDFRWRDSREESELELDAELELEELEELEELWLESEDRESVALLRVVGCFACGSGGVVSGESARGWDAGGSEESD